MIRSGYANEAHHKKREVSDLEDTIAELYRVIQNRKLYSEENSYTCYLFEKGLDKILKKVGEETSEVIIAAKNGMKEDTVGEIGDLVYHLLVLMAQQNIAPEDVEALLRERSQKIGNLKKVHASDKYS